MKAFYCRNRVFSRNGDSPPPKSERAMLIHTWNRKKVWLFGFQRNKGTGPGSGTARAMPMKRTRPPRTRVTGTGSGTAGRRPQKATPPKRKTLAKKDSAVRALALKGRPKTRVMGIGSGTAKRRLQNVTPQKDLASNAHQLPPKAVDEPLSFCTHKEKGHQGKHQGDPQARSERRPTGARAYLPNKDSAVRVQSPPLASGQRCARPRRSNATESERPCARPFIPAEGHDASKRVDESKASDDVIDDVIKDTQRKKLTSARAPGKEKTPPGGKTYSSVARGRLKGGRTKRKTIYRENGQD